MYHRTTFYILTLKSLREKAVYTTLFQSNSNIEIQKHYNKHTFIFSQVLSSMQSSICWIVVVLKFYLLYASSLSWYKYNSWLLDYIESIQIVQHGNFHWKTVFIAPTDVPFPSLHLGAQFCLSLIYIIIWNSLIFLWGWLIVVWMMLLQMRS